MDFKERIFTQILWSLIQIWQGIFGHWRELRPEDSNLSKSTRVFANPVNGFEMGTLEITDDNFQLWNQYLRQVDINKRKLAELRLRPERRPSENSKGSKQRKAGEEEAEEDGRRSKNKPEKKKAQMDGHQVKMETTTSADYLRAFNSLQGDINEIKKQIKELKILLNFIGNLTVRHIEWENSLLVESLEKILEMRKEWRLEDGTGKKKNKIGDESRWREMNNISYNNQYQIDAVFIINRLSEERENVDSKINERKGTDVEILKELTGNKMKEVFEKKLNYLNADKISKGPKGHFPKVTQHSGSKLNSMERLAEIYTKVFGGKNVTMEQIKDMSKLVDFIERYHGVVSNIDFFSSEEKEAEANRQAGGIEPKVLHNG